ncbi:unnamed protein product [Paramecium pentaurelia]|uniref:Uncharacterized protein n=1 Tax=Paramecium pentaurelia TaxID=43138 RepID=A0A8S1VEQ3_9CILI|nr:unnamed protein product [Paramecium pentaurelia]
MHFDNKNMALSHLFSEAHYSIEAEKLFDKLDKKSPNQLTCSEFQMLQSSKKCLYFQYSSYFTEFARMELGNILTYLKKMLQYNLDYLQIELLFQATSQLNNTILTVNYIYFIQIQLSGPTVQFYNFYIFCQNLNCKLYLEIVLNGDIKKKTFIQGFLYLQDFIKITIKDFFVIKSSSIDISQLNRVSLNLEDFIIQDSDSDIYRFQIFIQDPKNININNFQHSKIILADNLVLLSCYLWIQNLFKYRIKIEFYNLFRLLVISIFQTKILQYSLERLSSLSIMMVQKLHLYNSLITHNSPNVGRGLYLEKQQLNDPKILNKLFKKQQSLEIWRQFG